MLKDLSLIRNNKVFLLSASVIVAALIFFASQYVPIIVLILFLIISGRNQQQVTDLFTDNHAVQLLALSLITATGIFLIYRFLKWRGEKPLAFLMLKRRPTLSEVGDVLLTYGMYFVTLIIATILLSSFTQIDINQAQELGISSPETISALILVFISLVILPPLGEEILFRGFLYARLKKYSSTIIATVIVSILFGVAHLEYENLNWIAVVDTLIFSVYLIYISQKHKSLYSSMILHAIKNSIAFYVLFVR